MEKVVPMNLRLNECSKKNDDIYWKYEWVYFNKWNVNTLEIISWVIPFCRCIKRPEKKILRKRGGKSRMQKQKNEQKKWLSIYFVWHAMNESKWNASMEKGKKSDVDKNNEWKILDDENGNTHWHMSFIILNVWCASIWRFTCINYAYHSIPISFYFSTEVGSFFVGCAIHLPYHWCIPLCHCRRRFCLASSISHVNIW